MLDCACGSGIQLAAYGAALQRPLLGVELAEERAQARAMNVQTVAQHMRSGEDAWYTDSHIIAGDGTDAKGVIAALNKPDMEIAFLHLDPARPRNSRTHALE